MEATILEILIKSFKNNEPVSIQERNKVWEALEGDTKDIAIEQLESEGYALGNSLWNTDDLSDILEERGLEMSEEDKLDYLNNILSNDWITGEVWEAITINLEENF